MKREKLVLCCLTPEQHAKTCGYWFTITTAHGQAYKAFRTAYGLNRWMMERGLSVPDPLPEKIGEFKVLKIAGAFYDNMTFDTLPPGPETKVLSNGDYTRATITKAETGEAVINYQNPNVENRAVYPYQTATIEMS